MNRHNSHLNHSTTENDSFISSRLADHFNIYTREAGAGTLSVAVEGPSKAVMKLEERPHGFLGVSFKVEKPGNV